MTSSRTITLLAALALAAVLAGCKERKDPGFQGWVEADMIFVSPDESGRVTRLNVREGDEVKPGDAALFGRRRSAAGRPQPEQGYAGQRAADL